MGVRGFVYAVFSGALAGFAAEVVLDESVFDDGIGYGGNDSFDLSGFDGDKPVYGGDSQEFVDVVGVSDGEAITTAKE